MRAKTPSVVRKMKLEGTWKFVPVAKLNGRLDFTHVVYKGQRIPAGDSAFHLDFFDGGRRRRPCVGTDVAAVKRALLTQQHVLDLRHCGVEVDDAPELRRPAAGKALKAIVHEYSEQRPAGLSAKTHKKYAGMLQLFSTWAASVGITHALMVDTSALKNYIRDLRDKRGLDPSTVCDRVALLRRELAKHGCRFALVAADLPKATHREEVAVYSHDTLRSLFAACRPDEYVLFQTFLQSGMRDREVAFLAVDDILAKRSALRVSAKPALGFTPKNYHERIVAVPQWLVNRLLDLCARKGITSGLVFGTSSVWATVRPECQGGAADTKILLKLKRLARRAGLNCGRCYGSDAGKMVLCTSGPVCSKFWLHKFRHTYATNALRDGMDIKSLQRQLGHKDLDSTMRYLHALEPERLQEQVEASSLARIA